MQEELGVGDITKQMRGPKGIAGLTRLCEDCYGGTLVEVGSFAGESAVVFAQSGKFIRIICVDPWGSIEGELPELAQWYLDYDMDAVEREFDERTAPYPVIEKRKMTSEEAAEDMDYRVNMVYIDAVHEYEFVKQDIELWTPKVRSGGWICGHDYSLRFPGVVRAVNEAFGVPKVYEDESWAVCTG